MVLNESPLPPGGGSSKLTQHNYRKVVWSRLLTGGLPAWLSRSPAGQMPLQPSILALYRHF